MGRYWARGWSATHMVYHGIPSVWTLQTDWFGGETWGLSERALRQSRMRAMWPFEGKRCKFRRVHSKNYDEPKSFKINFDFLSVATKFWWCFAFPVWWEPPPIGSIWKDCYLQGCWIWIMSKTFWNHGWPMAFWSFPEHPRSKWGRLNPCLAPRAKARASLQGKP